MSDVTELRRILGPTLRMVDGLLDVASDFVVAVASKLRTTGADVDVSGAAPPSAGQALIATDATHATWQTITSSAPGAHKTTHENGGSDEISVAGLSGLLADGQTPLAHKTSHQDGGADEISVTGLSGVLADAQVADKIKTTTGPTTLTVGAVADGEFLKRVGSTVVGASAGGSSPAMYTYTSDQSLSGGTTYYHFEVALLANTTYLVEFGGLWDGSTAGFSNSSVGLYTNSASMAGGTVYPGWAAIQSTWIMSDGTTRLGNYGRTSGGAAFGSMPTGTYSANGVGRFYGAGVFQHTSTVYASILSTVAGGGGGIMKAGMWMRVSIIS